MNLQPQIDLLRYKIEARELLTIPELKQVLGALLNANKLNEAKVQSVAFAASHNVCEQGAVDAKRHNSAVIAEAIRTYLA